MVDGIATMMHPWKCLQWAIASPIKWAVAMGLGIFLGACLGGIAYEFAVSTAPAYPVLAEPIKVWRGKAGTIWISAHYESAAPFRCLRQDTQMLVDYRPGPRPVYFQAGSGMGGRGLAGSVYSYDILRALPADFPPGDWKYIVRLHYECEPFGWVHWEKTLPAVDVAIPE